MREAKNRDTCRDEERHTERKRRNWMESTHQDKMNSTNENVNKSEELMKNKKIV